GVAFGSAGGHSVFGEHLLKAALVGIAGRAFNAEGGSDAAKDNDREAAAVQLQFEIGAVECAPLTLEDNKIVGLAIELGNEFAPIGRKRPGHTHGLWRPSPPSGERPTCTRIGCAPTLRAASSNATVLAMTLSAECGFPGNPTMPFCRSMTTTAARRGSRMSSLIMFLRVCGGATAGRFAVRGGPF